jgi:hypothetical protein
MDTAQFATSTIDACDSSPEEITISRNAFLNYRLEVIADSAIRNAGVL